MIYVFFFKNSIKQKDKIFQILINIETHINHKFDGQGTTFDGGQNESNKKKNGKRIRFQPRHTKNRKSHILGRILWLWKKCDFHFPWMSIYIFWKK